MKRNIVEWAMHYRQIVILLTCCLMAFGVYGLSEMKKNEFPDFTIRQGIVVAACPGYTAAEVEEQVTKPLEEYIFSYKEVKKAKTHSLSKDGMAVVQVQLNDDLSNKDEFWSKFKHGVSEFKAELPQGVMALRVMDDFGDTSALLVTLESEQKTYRELNDYMDELKDRLRRVESVGRMTVQGMQKEQIVVTLDNDRLAHYGLSDQSLAMTLFTKGFATTAGRVKTDSYASPVYVSRSMNTLRDVQEMIVLATPQGQTVRLRDVADVRREYPVAESQITNNGRKCLLLSVEMKKGKNIVKMGDEVKTELEEFQRSLPDDVSVFKITDQSQVVADSVSTFLKELLIAICAVILVVVLLLPLRVALVAASTIPITIFISLGLFYAFGIELNTVTLAALIVALGMIVDNSIVIIDSYLEMIGKPPCPPVGGGQSAARIPHRGAGGLGLSRWHASMKSATHFFKSIFSATLAISITFFPFLFTMTGMTRDFIASFPWAVTLILSISLLVAELIVPFLLFWFIKKPPCPPVGGEESGGQSAARTPHRGAGGPTYNRLLDLCFRFPKSTLAVGALSVVAGIWLMSRLPQRLMPTAERNQFAVEIYMPTGTAVERTAQVADSLEHILRKDSRVVSVTSFKGCASPRFQNSYAPQMGGSNFAQFIVNTTGNDATVALLDHYTPLLRESVPEAVIRFKELGYSEALSPIEVRLSGTDLDSLRLSAERVETMLRSMPQLNLVRSNFNEPLAATAVTLDETQSTRLGVSNAQLESTLAMRYGSGITVGTAWEGDYNIDIVMKSNRADSADTRQLADEKIAVAGGLASVPLRQVASVEPSWQLGQIGRRNGVRTATVSAEIERGANAMELTSKVQQTLADIDLPQGVTLTYGGELEESDEQMPNIVAALAIAVAIIYFILVWHFKRVVTATLLLACLTLCFFGTALGVLIQGVDFGITCTMGIVSLMGILVRNGIIMIDYAEELRRDEHLHVREAIYQSAKRRMRPIFLTSAAAAMGVIPMILGGSGLWMPMGTVIFYGTLITMLLILTVIPVAYWKVMAGSTGRRAENEKLEQQ